MFERDYLLRLIEQVGKTLRALVAAREEQRLDDAERLLDEAAEEVTGTGFWAIERLGMPEVLGKLSDADGLDLTKTALAGELLAEGGALRHQQDDPDEAARLFRRALTLLSIAVHADADGDLATPERIGMVRAVADRVDADGPDLSARVDLFRVRGILGQLGKAEDELFRLADAGWEGALEEGTAFYRWCLSMRDEMLAAGGLPRDEVEEGLSDLVARLGGGERV